MPRLGAALLVACLASLSLLHAASDAPSPPGKPGLRESVKVNLIQLEVTVWPKKEDSDACLGLTADDFELLVNGSSHPIYAVDALGAEQDVYLRDSRLAAGTSARGLSLVLFFDLWHLGLFGTAFPACPATKPLAFSEARKFVQGQFHDGDRLLLVTAAGWPIVHYGWIRTKDEALRALDRLGQSNQIQMPRREHVHHNGWIAGIESLFLALGRYPGRKDVIYLADDFRFDDVAMRMYEIAARAQSNGVVVSAVDLLNSCRKIPCEGGGLGCTQFSDPVALNPLSLDTGGELFRTDRIEKAVSTLRSMRKCRYVVSFRMDAHKGKRIPSVTLNLRGNRKDLSLRAPSAFQAPEKVPSKQEMDEALFLLPRFGRGIAAEVTLWPYRPAHRRGRWKAFVMARIERTDDEPWPEELTQITVDVLPHRQSEDYGEFRKKIAGADLAAFRKAGDRKLLLFPLDEIRPGDTTVDVTVTSDIEEISASVRNSFDVPEPPGPGEARPWFLSDRLVRFGESEVLAPSLDEVVSAGQPVSFIGYGCHPKGDGPELSYVGRMVPFAGGKAVPVPITWLDAPQRSDDRCGWLVGRISSPDQPGLWTFEPPANLSSRKRPAAVEFNVVSEAAPTALPAELKPK